MGLTRIQQPNRSLVPLIIQVVVSTRSPSNLDAQVVVGEPATLAPRLVYVGIERDARDGSFVALRCGTLRVGLLLLLPASELGRLDLGVNLVRHEGGRERGKEGGCGELEDGGGAERSGTVRVLRGDSNEGFVRSPRTAQPELRGRGRAWWGKASQVTACDFGVPRILVPAIESSRRRSDSR
jgi:hypothetical protein